MSDAFPVRKIKAGDVEIHLVAKESMPFALGEPFAAVGADEHRCAFALDVATAVFREVNELQRGKWNNKTMWQRRWVNAMKFRANALRIASGEINFLALLQEIGVGDSEKQVGRLKDDVRELCPEVADLLPKLRGRPPGRKEAKPRKSKPVKGLNPNMIRDR